MLIFVLYYCTDCRGSIFINCIRESYHTTGVLTARAGVADRCLSATPVSYTTAVPYNSVPHDSWQRITHRGGQQNASERVDTGHCIKGPPPPPNQPGPFHNDHENKRDKRKKNPVPHAIKIPRGDCNSAVYSVCAFKGGFHFAFVSTPAKVHPTPQPRLEDNRIKQKKNGSQHVAK